MKNKCLVIRYGELFLKGKNRNDFIKKLIDNIKLNLCKNNFTDYSIKKLHDQLLITAKKSDDLTKILTSLQKVFGISNFYLAYQLVSKEEELVGFAENV